MILAEDLLERIRNLGTLNNLEIQGTDDPVLLEYISEELDSKIVPSIIRTREEFLTVTSRIPLVAGVTKYRIPPRAVCQRLRDFTYVDSAGNRTPFGSDPIRREELHHYNIGTASEPLGFFLEGPYIQMVPISGSYTGFLELAFYMRPSKLVMADDIRRIIMVDLVTGICSLDSDLPTNWTTANQFDIQTPLPGGELKIYDAVASQVGGAGLESQITFTTKIDGSVYGSNPVEIGDYLCLAGQCAQIMIPEDLLPQLIESVVNRIMYSGGDYKALQAGMVRVDQQLRDSLSITKKRLESKPMRISLHGTTLFPRRW